MFVTASPAKEVIMAQNIDTPYITDPALRKQLEESVTGKMKYSLMNDFLAKYGLQKDEMIESQAIVLAAKEDEL